MNVGDIVIGNMSNTLHCGTGIYSHAVCVQSEPLVLVSDDATMLWQHIDQRCLRRVGTAYPETLARCFKRFERDKANGQIG